MRAHTITIHAAALILGTGLISTHNRAHAEEHSVQSLFERDFDKLDDAKLTPDKLFYTERIVSFKDWAAQAPAESQDLVLYPGYKEPTVTTKKNGVTHKTVEKLMVFVSRFKMLLNKAPDKIDRAKLVDVNVVRTFDPEIEHLPIAADQFIGNVVGHGPVNNFNWGACAGQFHRPAREIDLGYTNPPQRAWCADPTHSLCLESCYLFKYGWQQGVNVVNMMQDEDQKKDPGIGFQSELRHFQIEAELGLPIPLSNLMNLHSPIHGGFEQNTFYFNQVFEFGKIIAVFQDHPNLTDKTVMTAYFVVGIKKRTYDSVSEVRDIIRGRSLMKK